MKDLALISSVYAGIAGEMDRLADEARERGDNIQGGRIAERRQVNDSAYFVLVWAQLENRINEVCRSAILKRLASPDWERRRGWDAHDPERLRLRFEDRAALILDRTNAANDFYRRTLRYYGLRNRIAHGESLATGLDVPFLINEVYKIIGSLKD